MHWRQWKAYVHSMPRNHMAVMALLLVPWTAVAQPVEFTGGAAFVLPHSSFTYETRYVPPVANIADFTGQAGQTLTLEPNRRPALWGAVSWFPARHVGVEARVRYRSATLKGVSGPHRLSLTYTSRQPPDYVPTQYTIERLDPRPDPEGHLRDLSFDLLAVGRFGDPRRIQLRLSGGLAILAISGDVQPVAFSHFQMGGHSVLFSDQHELTMAFERTWGFGAVAGVEVHRSLTRRAGLVAGIRALVPRTINAAASVTQVSESLFTLSPAEAQQALRPSPFRVRPWTFDVLVGVRLSL